MEEKEMMLKNHKYNLSDFALFLSGSYGFAYTEIWKRNKI